MSATPRVLPSLPDVASEDHLAAAARDGDTGALAALVERFRPMVWGMASDRFLPGGEHEDLVQEGMVGLWYAVRDHDETRGPFGPFARLCVDRQMWAAITKANRQRHRMLHEAVTLADWMDLPATATADPAAQTIIHETIADLRRTMYAALSSLESAVLALYADGYSYDAIADELDVHRKGIDNALQRARRKLEAMTSLDAAVAA